MNSIKFNSNNIISNGGSTSSSNNVRQSRLIQPTVTTNRFSYVQNSSTSSSSRKVSQNTNSTFLPTLSAKTTSREVTKKTVEKQQIYNKMESQPYYQHKQYLNNDQIPNANTSGLPALTSKQRPQMYIEQLRQQVVSPSIPSTIGSALRRRQASPSSIAKPISRLPSNQLSSSASSRENDAQAGPQQQVGNFALRRSQSQKPNLAPIINQHRQSTIGISNIRPSSKSLNPRSKSQLEQESSIEDDEIEDSSKCVESLPPLRSTTYITHLMNDRQESKSDIDANSEPICKTNSRLNLPSNSHVNSKPSQLVKPLMTKTHRSTLNNKSPGQVIKKVDADYNHPGSAKKSPNSRKLPGSMLPSLASKLKSDNCLSNHKRLSLQAARYNGSRDNKSSVDNDHRKLQLSSDHESDERSNDEDNEADDDADEDEDEDEDEDCDEDDDIDDDDATTAETMTQMSDSNMILTNANQELNNMIQLLSSKAILGESGIELTRDEQDLGQRKASICSTHTYKTKPSKNSTTRVKDEVIKSQSLCFTTNSPHKSDGNKPPITAKTNSNHDDNQYGEKRSSQQRCGNWDPIIRLPRPRSRIIFDPTRSEFHVSNFANDREQEEKEKENKKQENRYESVKYLSNNSSEEDSSSETTDNDLLNPFTDSCNQINVSQTCDTEQDEASLKLIDTHNQIITLKYLPTSESSTTKLPTKMSNRHVSQEIDTSNRLKGSLDSLIIPGIQRSYAIKDTIFQSKNDAQAKPYGQLPSSNQVDHSTTDQRQKSPVGSALRTLFGLQPSSSRNSIHVVNNNNLSKNDSKGKVATIVRHGSLKSDPRSYIDVHDRPMIERKISLQWNGKTPNNSTKPNLGSDLFQRASKKFSASSSSLTSKFKFISSASSQANTSTKTTTTTAPTTNEDSNFANHYLSITPTGGSRELVYHAKNNGYCGQKPLTNSLQVSTIT